MCIQQELALFKYVLIQWNGLVALKLTILVRTFVRSGLYVSVFPVSVVLLDCVLCILPISATSGTVQSSRTV